MLRRVCSWCEKNNSGQSIKTECQSHRCEHRSICQRRKKSQESQDRQLSLKEVMLTQLLAAITPSPACVCECTPHLHTAKHTHSNAQTHVHNPRHTYTKQHAYIRPCTHSFSTCTPHGHNACRTGCHRVTSSGVKVSKGICSPDREPLTDQSDNLIQGAEELVGLLGLPAGPWVTEKSHFSTGS